MVANRERRAGLQRSMKRGYISVKEEVDATKCEESEHKLEILCSTWKRDSHDLYDYEACNIVYNKMSGTGYLMRKDNQLKMVISPKRDIQGFDALCHIRKVPAGFGISPIVAALPSAHVKRIWLVVKELHNGEWILSEGDTLKLGRCKIKVKQINSDDTGKFIEPRVYTNVLALPNVVNNTPNVPQEADTCRICWQETHDDNILINPCGCKGSIEWIHLKCLKEWVTDQLDSVNNSGSTYGQQGGQAEGEAPTGYASHNGVGPHVVQLKDIVCELCKRTFPIRLYWNGSKYDIVKVDKYHDPFIVLECIGTVRTLCIISLPKRKQSAAKMGDSDDTNDGCNSDKNRLCHLGRGHASDWRVSDVSISRLHSKLHYNEKTNQFLLCDSGSKFGTLVALRKGMEVTKANPAVTLQSGRSLFRFQLNRSHNAPHIGGTEKKHKRDITNAGTLPLDAWPQLNGDATVQPWYQEFQA